MRYFCWMTTPLGDVTLEEEDGLVTGIRFGKVPVGLGEQIQTCLLKSVQSQLDEYFQGKRREFSLPLAPRGTEFQKKVWKALQEIPYGETRSYGQIAGVVGSPKAGRAVGMANHQNPIAIVIPCHRVIGADGKLTGYAGGLEKKTALLMLERSGKQGIEI